MSTIQAGMAGSIGWSPFIYRLVYCRIVCESFSGAFVEGN